MSRRKARILAFQGLYSWDVGNIAKEDVLELNWVDFANETEVEETKTFARLLIAGTIENHEKIDSLIKAHLSPKWDFERLNKVSLSVLRMGVYSLLYQKELSSSIVIDEAISITKNFGQDDSHRFVNAVLDAIRKEIAA